MKHKHVLLPVTSSLTCTSDTSKQHSQNSKESLAGEETLPVKDQSQENSSGVGDSDAGERVENSGWPHFSEVFMVSALTGDGMDSLRVNSISLWLVGCDESCSNKFYDLAF